MGIWKAWVDGVEFGWNSPVQGPVHPAFVPIDDPSGFGWLEGFDELLCRCGLQSNGAPDFDEQGRLLYPLHGRIANLPAEEIQSRRDDAGVLHVTGDVHEARFHHQHLRLRSTVTVRPGEAGFAVHDEVTNLSGWPARMQLLYHFNLGPPVLGSGASLLAPIMELAPRNARAAEGIDRWDSYRAPEPVTEQVYFGTVHARPDDSTLALLKSADGRLGSSVRWNRAQLPCFVLWKNTNTLRDGYVTGIEPGTNFPNPHRFEADCGRTLALAPGESRSFDLSFVFHTGAASVQGAIAEIEALRASQVPPVIHRMPLVGRWSAREPQA
jgi:galactose mutarotase-like enzyme